MDKIEQHFVEHLLRVGYLCSAKEGTPDNKNLFGEGHRTLSPEKHSKDMNQADPEAKFFEEAADLLLFAKHLVCTRGDRKVEGKEVAILLGDCYNSIKKRR